MNASELKLIFWQRVAVLSTESFHEAAVFGSAEAVHVLVRPLFNEQVPVAMESPSPTPGGSTDLFPRRR